MRWRRWLRHGPLLLLLGLGSCSIAGEAVIRNASAADILLWPLGELPLTLKPGEATQPIIYSAYKRQQAMIQRGGCLYTYPAPNYFELPKEAKGYASRVVVEIDDQMTLRLHPRSKNGVEGPEILVAGFPLKPQTFCGRP